jgi:DNA-binding PadR family transcriptional regulator
VKSEWQLSPNNRRAKFYQLTTRGRQQLRTETASWTEFVDAVGKVLRTTAQPA